MQPRDAWWRWIGAIAMAAVSLSACESEREFSGIWRQVCDDEFLCTEDQTVFELNIGRYGDEVTGTVVQYVYAAELMTFDRLNDCGCFFMESGRASANGLGFRLLDPERPGYPDQNRTRADSCTAMPPPPCVDGVFTLAGDEDQLEGRLSCDGVEGPVIRFRPARGAPRRTCLWPDAE